MMMRGMMKILGGLKDSQELTHSQLLEGLKCESQTENNGRANSQATPWLAAL
jgi:hypothetical protein